MWRWFSGTAPRLNTNKVPEEQQTGPGDWGAQGAGQECGLAGRTNLGWFQPNLEQKTTKLLGPTGGDDAGAAVVFVAAIVVVVVADVDVEWQAIICLVQRPTTCFSAVSLPPAEAKPCGAAAIGCWSRPCGTPWSINQSRRRGLARVQASTAAFRKCAHCLRLARTHCKQSAWFTVFEKAHMHAHSERRPYKRLSWTRTPHRKALALALLKRESNVAHSSSPAARSVTGWTVELTVTCPLYWSCNATCLSPTVWGVSIRDDGKTSSHNTYRLSWNI